VGSIPGGAILILYFFTFKLTQVELRIIPIQKKIAHILKLPQKMLFFTKKNVIVKNLPNILTYF
jgi:hypothetical protein